MDPRSLDTRHPTLDTTLSQLRDAPSTKFGCGSAALSLCASAFLNETSIASKTFGCGSAALHSAVLTLKVFVACVDSSKGSSLTVDGSQLSTFKSQPAGGIFRFGCGSAVLCLCVSKMSYHVLGRAMFLLPWGTESPGEWRWGNAETRRRRGRRGDEQETIAKPTDDSKQMRFVRHSPNSQQP